MNKLVLFDIDYTLFDTDSFKESNLTNFSLYEEIGPLLEKLSKISTLAIFSKGEIDFQINKLKNTGIDKYFSEEFIDVVVDKTEAFERVLDKYKNYEIYLIDDRIHNLETAKKHRRDIRTIWVERGPFAVKDTNFIPDKSISDLREIEGYINDEK